MIALLRLHRTALFGAGWFLATDRTAFSVHTLLFQTAAVMNGRHSVEK
jgi:hypothetical protein